MLTPKNMGHLTCGLTADPEIKNNTVAVLRLASDYAGYERDSDNKTGYFDGRVLLNTAACGNFVRQQIENGNLKKGSQIEILFQLQQDRWKNENGDNRSRVSLVIEGMSYVSGGRADNAQGGGGGNAAQGTAQATAGEEDQSGQNAFPTF